MSAISSTLASALSQLNQKTIAAAQSVAADANSSSTGNSTFGEAVNVTLSVPAQSLANGQGVSNDNATGQSNSASAAGGKKSSPLVLPSSSSSSTDTATLVEEALQQVIPQVGVKDASEVVDSKGNIDQVKLNKLLAQQNATSTSA